jgi:hypothetical protein
MVSGAISVAPNRLKKRIGAIPASSDSVPV